ncbi:MAG: hypothetical protein COA78_02640 [Blastopirellula sp.]|nr:MAG: hypothetical protein COA78_02640 [Blastopirellula sp.]
MLLPLGISMFLICPYGKLKRCTLAIGKLENLRWVTLAKINTRPPGRYLVQQPTGGRVNGGD